MTNETIEKWNRAADSYAAMQEKSEFVCVNKKVVTTRFQNLLNKKVLDLGCGYGWYTNFFHSIGANVTGCDGSEKMLELAREKYPECNFECTDIEKRLPYENNSFDLVFCNQVIMDIENIEGLFKEVFRITKVSGIFYFSIVHPAFYDSQWGKDEKGFRNAKIMTKYLSEYSFDNEHWGKTAHYHRTISKYINTAIEKGFRLIRLEEPVSYDGVSKSKEFPLFLFVEFGK
jgi:methionine biosynthesis protein metW